MCKPLLLDLFCGAGGCSKGYNEAGFRVVGVDINHQPNYPFFNFIQADAVQYLQDNWQEYDAIAASPPCLVHTVLQKLHKNKKGHTDLIGPVRDLLITTGKPYIIENVVGAPLVESITLCGTMFGLQTAAGAELWRHRLFETNWPLVAPGQCNHYTNGMVSVCGVYGGGQHPERRARKPKVCTVTGATSTGSTCDGTDGYGIIARHQAMGIDWMVGKELNQAIPPTYTRYIGEQLLKHLNRNE